MVGFTVSLLWWLFCAIFRFFVIVWTGYGIYSFIKDKIDDKKLDKYIEKAQEQHKKEMEEAERRIAKLARKKKLS